MAWSIRRFERSDAQAVAALIARTLREVNIRDYSAEYIEDSVGKMSAGNILDRAGWTHFYVALDGAAIIGCGAIGPYWGSDIESSLFTIFVLPDYQKRGVGRLIMETLESDEYFLRARRIEIPASITGCGFYRTFGYDYKGGVTEPDGEGLLRLEKHRKEITNS